MGSFYVPPGAGRSQYMRKNLKGKEYGKGAFPGAPGSI
jgi:hypothetical protein